MTADWEYSDLNCPKCNVGMRARSCESCAGEGFIELYDEDPLWYDEDDTEVCDRCNGHGVETWCGECGWDETFKCFMSKDYEAAWLAKQTTEGSKS